MTIQDNEYKRDLRHMEYMKHMADKDDMVNHPQHYNNAGIETIDAIGAMCGEGFECYLQGNILKYLWRYKYKNGVEDLSKAKWYLDKLIEVYDDKS